MQVWRQVALILVLIVGAAFTRTVRLSAFDQHQRGRRYEDVYYLPDEEWLPLLSLGYRAALSDLIWCKSLIYFGEELGHRGIVRHVFAYTDAILTLDPSFRAAYRWVATAAFYRPTQTSMETALHAASYLQRATDRWPSDGELQWDYGSLLRFEVAPLEKDSAKKRHLLEKAAPHLAAAARLGAGPPWLALNNVELLNKLGRTEQAIHQLEQMLETVQDETMRRDVEWQLGRLRTASYLEAARVVNEQFESERLQRYPYLSPSMFLLVAPETATASDSARLTDSELVRDKNGRLEDAAGSR